MVSWIDECMWCGRNLGDLARAVPHSHDDAAWADEATRHEPDCYWVETKGEAPAGDPNAD